MFNGQVTDTRQAAIGLLGPSIATLERLVVDRMYRPITDSSSEWWGVQCIEDRWWFVAGERWRGTSSEATALAERLSASVGLSAGTLRYIAIRYVAAPISAAAPKAQETA